MQPPGPLSLSPGLLPFLCFSLPRTPEHARRHRLLPPCPPHPLAPPTGPQARPSSATPSPPIYATGRPSECRHRCHLHPRVPTIAAGIPTPSSLPRARFDDLCNHRELPRRNLLSPRSFTPCSHRPLADQIAPPPGLVASVAPVTIGSRACVQHANCRA